ncbi:MAG: PLP-dependent aminotransferase family protein [Gemmatimonadaceae bacterium]|nr:PLP-dependent aminotransferase family protein [Gemmatimonadaceae bacterium]MCW5826522.1 PLP-dependent aminotransferase family protein [Gemmatimonadaceae bacterium]
MTLHFTLSSRRDAASQVYRQMRDAILDGRLHADDALPPTRRLAAELGLSRTTVTVVYERLRAEGFVVSRVGAGTFVRPGIRQRSESESRETLSALTPRALWETLPEGLDMSGPAPRFDFRTGLPDARQFPYAAWRRRMATQLQQITVGTGAHIDAAGLPALRAAIARHLRTSRGLTVAADDVLVTSGSQQAIDLVTRVLLEPRQVVAMEDPGYQPARRAFLAHGCTVRGVPVDAAGLVVDALPARARLVYVTPSHQYPLGIPMSMERRQALLSWAAAHHAAVVEDDYDSEFRFGGRPLEPLRSLDTCGRVLYVGSFSKSMLPTLRLGFVVAPSTLHAALRKAKHATDWHSPVPTQAALAQFLEDGVLAQHLRRLRRAFTKRHDTMRELLTGKFRGVLTPIAAPGGLHLAATFDDPAVDDCGVAQRAHERGVAMFPLSPRYVDTPPRSGLLLGYGGIEPEDIAEGLRRLSECI